MYLLSVSCFAKKILKCLQKNQYFSSATFSLWQIYQDGELNMSYSELTTTTLIDLSLMCQLCRNQAISLYRILIGWFLY